MAQPADKDSFEINKELLQEDPSTDFGDDLELDIHVALPIPNGMGCACPGITYPVDGLGPQLSIPNGIRLTPPGIG